MISLNIPHQDPIKFAQEVLSIDEVKASVLCEFPYQPTLPMFFEAAAQSSAAFSLEQEKVGFIISVKEVELIHETQTLQYVIDVTKEQSMNNIYEFSFLVFTPQEKKLVAKGILTLMIMLS